MTDELDRIRALQDEAPPPSPAWVEDTRDELLAMAAEEERRPAVEPGREPAAAGLLERLRRRAAVLVEGGRRPVALAGAAAVLLLAVAGVTFGVLGDDPDAPVAGPTAGPTATPTGPDPGMVLASSCTGGDGLYTVGYPEGWYTNPGEVAQACQRFDDEPVDLEEGTGGGPSQPVTVRVLPVGLDRAATAGPAAREESRRSTTVAGRDAVVVDWVSTGAAASPEGLRSHRYLVDLGDRTLMLAAHDVGDVPYEQSRDVVEAMAGSLALDGAPG